MDHRMVQGLQVLSSVSLLCQCAGKALSQILRENQARPGWLLRVSAEHCACSGSLYCCSLGRIDVQDFPKDKTLRQV